MPMNRRPISGQEAAADVRRGMSDRQLMTKYDLSAAGLLSLFSKLVQAGMLTEAEVADRLALAAAEIDVDFARPLIEAEPIPGAPVTSSGSSRLTVGCSLHRLLQLTQFFLEVGMGTYTR